VSETLEEYLEGTEHSVGTKWMNDIFVDGKFKISGVLCTSENYGGKFQLNAGIGVNLNTKGVPETTTLSDLLGNKEIDVEEFVKKLLKNLTARVRQLDAESFGEESSVRKAVLKRLAFMDDKVNIFDG